jgi:DNA polymerase III epsilon subunit-like protein
MIILDIETSGLNPESCGIWQIGAIDLENSENYFLEEGRINDNDEIAEGALLVTGKSREYFLNENKQSEKELLAHFFKWCESVRIKNCLCQNPQFDLGFVTMKARKYELKSPLAHRAFDLHSIAQLKYFQIKNNFLFKENHSDMNLSNILNFCGIKDERRHVDGIELISEGKEHNALEDCKITGECFSRIVYGKNIFREFSKFSIPEYLI